MDGALRAFSSFMDGSSGQVPWVVLWLLVLSPMLVLVHELGHAVVALSRTDGLVTVDVGRQPAPWHGRVGRLVLAVSPVPGLADAGGCTRAFTRMAPRDQLAVALGGPLAHGAASLVLLFVALDVSSTAIAVVAVVSLLTAGANLVPFTAGAHRSDGRRILDVLRPSATRPAATELTDTASRWLVLFTAKNGWFQTELRAQLMGGAPVALGYAPDDRGPEASALWSLAWAGWCWREAERGDPQRLRAAALDAVHRAGAAGLVEPRRTERATQLLVTSGTELGVASPGPDDESQRRFLWAAFAGLPAELKPSSITAEQQRFAFLYGVALHDVELARS